jgi:hypothetical protein
MAKAGIRQAEPALLGIYLNDHLAGATGGVELARRMAGSHDDGRGTLQHLAAEVAQDRAALLGVMGVLGIPVRGYKVWAGWIGVGRAAEVQRPSPDPVTPHGSIPPGWTS